MPLNSYRKPCPGGYQIQAGDMPLAGTLGAKVRWGAPVRDVVITAGHIVDNLNAAVFQPGAAGTVGEVQRIGSVAGRSVRRTYRDVAAFIGSGADSPEERITSRFDFAYIDVSGDPTATSYRIPGLNDADLPLAVREPREGEQVQWLGSQTGFVRSGRVVDLSFWLPRSLDDTNLVNQQFFSVQPLTLIEVEGNVPTREGDSGAAIVAVDDRNIVGVHCYGTKLESGKVFSMASRIPASPQALADGAVSVAYEEVLRWLARLKLWRAS
ncbi:hypothetical protein ABTZ03_09760 [Kitasatospora sp. NPDC096077]|uniref:hypothetical protein n=1 Tax=Kitasatospora sp. NPDC096077 TaxID=3155544 RepID=UPI0033303280